MNKYKLAFNRLISHFVQTNMFPNSNDEWNNKLFEEDKETINELVERATSKKPIGDLDSVPHYRCPVCYGGVKMYENSYVFPYCHHCGQALDWSEEQ